MRRKNGSTSNKNQTGWSQYFAEEKQLKNEDTQRIHKIAKQLKFKKFETFTEKIGKGKSQYEFTNPKTVLRAGMIIRLKDKSLHIVGTVNKLRGICDDCTICEWSEIVEYADMFEQLNLG